MVGRGPLVLKPGNGDIHKSEFPIKALWLCKLPHLCKFFLKHTDPIMIIINHFAKLFLVSRIAKRNSRRNPVITLLYKYIEQICWFRMFFLCKTGVIYFG